ncbi:MAG: DUF4173 domain-containing protein [Patescibacteria group bacterium]
MKLKLSYVLAIAALTLALVVDVLFYSAPNIGLNMLLAEAAFVGISVWIARSQKIAVTRPAMVAAGFALAFAATFAVWTSTWSLTMDFISFLVANLLFVAFMLGETHRFRHPMEIVSHLFLVPAKHAVYALPFVRTLLPEKASAQTRTVVKAIIIALPILFVFTLVFVAADAVFRSYIVDFFTQLNEWFSVGNVIGHGMFVGFFFVLFCLFFAAAFWRKMMFGKKHADAPARAVLESKIILGSVAVLFAVFLVVSGSALFGGTAAFANLDITYSQYAREGFGQLCAASILVIGLLMTLRVLHTELVDKKLLGLQITLLAEAALVLVSAFMRLGMYINAYGYTPARLFGLWFFALITIFLALTLVNILHRKHQSTLVTQILLVAAGAILLFTVLNPDALSTRLNAARTDLDLRNGLPNLENTDYPTDTWQSWNYTRMYERRLQKVQ